MIVAGWRSVAGEGRCELEVRDSDGDVDVLWYEFDGDQAAPIPERLDVAAVALLSRAMRQGVDLHLEGSVDRSLLANLEKYQDRWARWRPQLFRRIRISADAVDAIPNEARCSRVAAVAFSGGVDSCYTVASNATGALGEGTVDVGVAVMVHGFDVPVDDREGFSVARERARAILSDFDIPLMCVRTNWRDREFCPHWTMSFTAGLASVLHQFSDRAGVGLVSSEGVYGREVLPWGSNSKTNPLLGSARFPLRTVGLDTGRTARCRLIGEWASIRDNVRVCYAGPRPGINCGTCAKCVTTKLNFLVAGVGEIPALGPLSPQDVRKMQYDGPWRLAYMRDIASHGDGVPTSFRRSLKVQIRRHWWRAKLAALRHRVRIRSRLATWRRSASASPETPTSSAPG